MTATPQTAPDDDIGRNSLLMFIGTFGSRILGFVRGALLTVTAGAALAADAFTLGNSLPTILYVMINGGLLSAVLIPQIVRAMGRPDGGHDFTDRLLTLSFLVLGGFTAIAMVGTPWIVDALSQNKDPQFLSFTTTFAYICMPQLFFYGLYAVLGQVLNARGEFSAYAWAPAWANVINIIGLVYFLVRWGLQPDLDAWTTEMVWVLAGSTTLGIVVQGVGLLIPLRRTGFRFRPRFGWRGYGFGDVSRMALWTMAALGITQLVALVTTRALTSGTSRMENVAGNAVQQFAYTLFILPLGITAVKQRYAFARGDGWFNLWTVAVMAGGNLLTAYLAMVHTRPEYVVAVIGLGASLSSTAAALCFVLVARRQLDGLDLPQVVRLWVRLVIAAGLPAVLAWWLSSLIAEPGSPWVRSVIALAVGGSVLALGFLGLAKAMRVTELDRMLVPVVSRARRLVGR